jgi:aldose 1-epimerase
MGGQGADIHELRCGPLRAQVLPALGGSLAGLWLGDEPVLRSSPPAQLDSPRQSACFPLLPYSNRLGHRRFRWGGQDHATAANFDDSPHSLHGVAWLRAWQVLAPADGHDPNVHLRMRYGHAPDAHWPFAFEAQQTVALEADALVLTLSLRNTDPRTQPAGLGWHPYFVRRADTRIDIGATQRWDKDDSELPLHPVPVEGLHTAVQALALDHCFSGWDGVARVQDARLQLELSSDLRWLVVFTPPGRDFFCIEPVSHRNNAIQADDPLAQGLVALAPGQTLQAQMRLRISSTPITTGP